jgi:protein tyrosine phosphatase type 4A
MAPGYSSAHFLHSHYGGHGGPARLPNPPTFVEWNGMRFLIMDAPSDSNIDLYLKEMKRCGVTDLVRVCDPTYSAERVERAGINVHEMTFPDGDRPPDKVVDKWLALVDQKVVEGSGEAAPMPTVAVHCVAGLGRAPVLVAISLIESGMSPLDAVTFLRERRRGAINNKQLRYLETYRPKGKSGSSKCLLM